MPWTQHASPEVNAKSEYPAIIGVALSLTVLMTTVVGTRAYVRARVVKFLGSDDYVTLFSTVITIVYVALCIRQTRLGLGLPVKLRPKPDLAEYSLINFVGRPLYMAGITGYKVALCFAYLRITSGALPNFRRVTWGLMAFIVVSHLTSTLVLIFQCRPVAKSWKPTMSGWCLPDYPTWNATAAITIFCDVLTFMLPLPLFAHLQIDRRRKFSLMLLFVLGLLTTVCSVLRMVQIEIVAKNGDNSTLVLWATAEMNIGISLTCLPALAPLFKCLGRDTGNGTPGYAPSPYDTKGNAVRLQSVSKSTTNPERTSHPKDAKMDEHSSEEDILPLHGAHREDQEMDSHWITKTTDVQITRSKWYSSERVNDFA